MTGLHLPSGDQIVAVIAMLMALTLVIARMTRRFTLPRSAIPMLVWMAFVWAAIIATAALAFQHFRPGEM